MITQKKSPYRLITDKQLAGLRAREDALFQKRTRKSKETFDKAQEMLLNGVPMPWMGDWGTSHPIFVSKASGNRVTDIDGNEYVDFCLGDTGAMFGHSPQATADPREAAAARDHHHDADRRCARHRSGAGPPLRSA